MTISDAPSCGITYNHHSDYLRGVVYDGNIFIIQVPGLTLKHYTMLEKLAGDKHSSLLRKFAKY